MSMKEPLNTELSLSCSKQIPGTSKEPQFTKHVQQKSHFPYINILTKDIFPFSILLYIYFFQHLE